MRWTRAVWWIVPIAGLHFVLTFLMLGMIVGDVITGSPARVHPLLKALFAVVFVTDIPLLAMPKLWNLGETWFLTVMGVYSLLFAAGIVYGIAGLRALKRRTRRDEQADG